MPVTQVPLNDVELAVLRYCVGRARWELQNQYGDPLNRVERIRELDILSEKMLAFYKVASGEVAQTSGSSGPA